MYTENVDQAGRNLAAEAMAADALLKAMESRHLAGSETIPRKMLPDGSAFHGLVIAVPVALVLWMGIGMFVWAMVH